MKTVEKGRHGHEDGGKRRGTFTTGPSLDNVERAQACAYNELDLVREFVEKDPKCVDAPDEQGYSALQWAALNNRVAVISYLLENGADVNRYPDPRAFSVRWRVVVIDLKLRWGGVFR